jgi:hypothetical protein
MIEIKIKDEDWTIEANAAEYEANGETPERARELAETEEAYMINHAYGVLPGGWRYAGDGEFVGGRASAYLTVQRTVEIILSLRTEATDFALQAK